MRHYRIDKATPCEVRPKGSQTWRREITDRRLWHVAKTDDAGKWVFDMGDSLLRVEPRLVRGAASRAPDQAQIDFGA